jgi:4-hydroxy-2-oxoheptanedioate aldolase
VPLQVEAIAKVDGVDVLLIGPYDLGNNLGHPITTGEPDEELKAAIEKIRKAAIAAGKKAGIYCISGDQARRYADQGFHMVCSTSISLDV